MYTVESLISAKKPSRGLPLDPFSGRERPQETHRPVSTWAEIWIGTRGETVNTTSER